MIVLLIVIYKDYDVYNVLVSEIDYSIYRKIRKLRTLCTCQQVAERRTCVSDIREREREPFPTPSFSLTECL
jgi:hypothetical protein